MKTLLLSIVLLTITNCLFAQNTTQDEFNFMVNGYKSTIEQGLDMKRGYSLQDTMNFSTSGGSYKIVFYSLVRNNDKSLAGTISVVTSAISNKSYYLAIPAVSPNFDLEGSTMSLIKNFGWDGSIKTGYLQSLVEYLSIMMTKKYNSHK